MTVAFITTLLVLLVSTDRVRSDRLAADGSSTSPQTTLNTDAALGTAFTYQGRLTEGGNPANGAYDFTFRLFDAASGGSQAGATIDKNGVSVADGLFVVTLDFGSVFTGNALYLDIGVRPAGSSTYTALTPRKPLTAAPYSSYALKAPWSGLSGVPAGLDDGDNDTTYQAGSGLALSAGVFSVDFAGNGTASTASHSDHIHMGQTWVNENAILHLGTSTGLSSRANSFNGIEGSTFAANRYGGRFENMAHIIGTGAGGPGLYASSSGNQYPDIVLGGNDSNNDDGTIRSEPNMSTSDIILYANDRLHIHLDEVGVNPNSDFAIKNGANVNVFRVDEGGVVTASGPLNCDDPCVIQKGTADFAEMLPAVLELEPGDVLIIGADGLLALSTQPYQANVVGVLSTRPGYLGGGVHLGQDGYVPLAVVGVAPVKVSAENGPIQPGDLLTSSGTAGHAMRAGENPPTGTVIGKALQALETGTGLIQMLVVLQ